MNFPPLFPTRPSRLSLSFALVLAFGVDGSRLPAQDNVPVASRDSIFDDLDRTHRPGCAVSVIRNGRLETARGYGMANLEYGVPIAPSSVFHVASVSKHVTALAVGLLVSEGRVSWEDDIREYVPELPDTGHTITLDHLVHHTGGVRDQWELLIMGGWRWEADLVRQNDALGMITRQPALNFPPGTDWVYSNSGYTLLAEVVARVSGRSLAEFAEERIFEPLGMHRTHFRDDHEALVPDRAYGYAPDGEGGWKISIPDFAVVGATSLFTTVEDLARWERNFRTAEVGGREVVEDMLHRVEVAGEEHGYAHGLFVGEHRGLRSVRHGGADAGYRAHFVRYPDQGLAVAVLCNDPTAGPQARARAVAELYLANTLEPQDFGASSRGAAADEAQPDTAVAALDSRPVERLVGWYATSANDHPVRIARGAEGGLVFAIGNRPPRPLVPRSDTTFQVAGGSPTLRVPSDQARWGEEVRVDDGSGEPRRHRRVAPADTSREALLAYEGRYRSDAVDALYEVRVGADGGLELRHRRHGTIPLNPMHRDAFSFRADLLALTFTRDEGGRVNGLTMSGPRAWKIAFRREEEARGRGR